MKQFRLLKEYHRDMVWWIASGADPEFVTYSPGETLYADEDEAKHLLAEGIAEPCPDAEGRE